MNRCAHGDCYRVFGRETVFGPYRQLMRKGKAADFSSVNEEVNYNPAFLRPSGLNPEEKLPEFSLLAKFRTQRLRGHAILFALFIFGLFLLNYKLSCRAVTGICF